MPYPEPRSEFTAPGVRAEMSGRERAVEYARRAIVMFSGTDHDLTNLARQYLRMLGLPEQI